MRGAEQKISSVEKSKWLWWHQRPWRRPLAGLLSFLCDHHGLVLLESRRPHRWWGRWSFLGVDPFWGIAINTPAAYEKAVRRFRRWQGYLRRRLRASPTPLSAGVMGFLGYDWAADSFCGVHRKGGPRPQGWLGFFDTILAWDQVHERLWLTMVPREHKVKTHPRWDGTQRRKFERLLGLLDEVEKRPFLWPEITLVDEWRAERTWPAKDYQTAVRRVLDLIHQGDVYQLNLCRKNTFFLKRPLSSSQAMALYQKLQMVHPAPFSGYCDPALDVLKIASASPEEFLRIEGGRIITRPMKGTRPAGVNEDRRRYWSRELWMSQKEQAELLMITDLLRNDLGRVCRTGSVHVKRLRRLERFQHVLQTTSEIEGMLCEDRDVWDALAVMLPGGSVTGCPKKRAVERIAQLEPEPRGAYTGILGYAGVNGASCWNILIRSLFVERQKIWYGVGSGIVADSSPCKEWEETIVKEKALRQAVADKRVLFDDTRRWVYESPGFYLRPAHERVPVWHGDYDGVFETMLAHEGRVPLWSWHRDRIKRALQRHGAPFNARRIFDIIRNGVAAHPWRQQRVRLTVDIHTHPGRVRVEWFAYQRPKEAQDGWVVGCRRLRRSIWDEGVRTKTTRYQSFHRLHLLAQRQGWREMILIHPDGWVVEGTRTNVFWIDMKTVIKTPHPKTGALAGVGARWLKRWAHQRGLDIEQGRFTEEDLCRAKAVFLTNALVGVVRVAVLVGSDKTIRFKPHPLIEEMQQAWLAMIAGTPLQSRSGDSKKLS